MRLDEAHGLHRDRRGAGDAAKCRDILADRPQNRFQADAVMREEPGVFGGDDGLGNPIVAVGPVSRAAVDVALYQYKFNKPIFTVWW